ncbi:NAD(P)-binding protein [Polyplosphaeria fusca]|uniref:NAD(P)-binding protein n=1 Tax=Polyplosphaeria fusca TaxID=682080 RepID=A0A9P4V1E0_9PLEO|nr:NAD(P)-binding protein [Polyplosphaeria fusca]
MVKIAIAGGSGNVAQEIIDALVAAQKHEILILSRKDGPTPTSQQNVTWVKASYDDPDQLAQTLQGVHTLLSFVIEQDNPSGPVQKNLINAAVKAGVKRFAPSEWATSKLDHMPWYAYKAEIRRYLEDLNKDQKVLEYTLWQPGLFVNYLTAPYQTTTHIHQLEIPFDFQNRRALVLDGGDESRINWITVQDMASIVVKAIDFEGEWPVVSGILGTELSIAQLIALGEKVRGGTFKVERLEADDLKSGTWTASWMPKIDHPSLAPEQVAEFSRVGLAGFLLAISNGAFSTSDEWNRLLPDHTFTGAEEFLADVWRGKP